MKKIMIFTLLAFATITQAQTDTPTPTSTPHNDALVIGMYQFEDLSSPQIELTGTWSVDVDETTETLVSSEDDATMTFHVNEFADYIIIHREVKPALFGTWSMCIDAMPCLDVSDYSTGMGIEPIAFQLPDTNSQIVITKTNSNESAFDFMTIEIGEGAIWQEPNVIVIPLIATPIPTPAPNDFEYVEATDEVGESYSIRRERVVTIADEFNGYIGVMSLICLFGILVVLLWKS